MRASPLKSPLTNDLYDIILKILLPNVLVNKNFQKILASIF